MGPEGHKDGQMAGYSSCEDRLKELGFFSLEKIVLVQVG